jgi:serine/threonine protein phosphatase PrpC
VKKTIEKWPAHYARMAVADGMGGHRNGQEIAQAAVEKLILYPPATSRKEMHDAVMSLHNELSKLFNDGSEDRPGTTLVVADLNLAGGHGILASVGDSRAYRVYQSRAHQLTKDHTGYEFAYRDGIFDKARYGESLLTNPHGLWQAMGYGSSGRVRDVLASDGEGSSRDIRLDLFEALPPDLADHSDVKSFRLARDCAMILSSDGLWNASPEGQWQGPLTAQFLSRNEIEIQANKALADGSNDNITLVIFGYHGIENEK